MATFPEELKALKRWVVHRNKIPFQPSNGHAAKAGQPDTWASYDEALDALTSCKYDGLGFQFHNDGIVGIDLDHCLDPQSGELESWALDIVQRLNSYTEMSPSGTGLHIYVKGDIPFNGKKHTIDKTSKQAIEIYKSQRYFTVTGHVFNDAPIREKSAELQAICDQYFKQPKPQRPPISPLRQDYLSIGL